MARLGGFVNKLLTLTTGLGLAVATIAPVAQAQPADTTHISHDPLFTTRDAWIASGVRCGHGRPLPGRPVFRAQAADAA